MAEAVQLRPPLDEETVRELAREEARRKRWGRVALWIGALSLAVLAAASLGWLD